MKNLLLFSVIFSFIVYFTAERTDIAPLALPGKQVKLYTPQTDDNLENLLVHEIRKAKTSVVLATYTFQSAKIIQALNDAARTGVNVRVIYDAKASSSAGKKLVSEIQATPRGLNGLMHLKLLIIDNHHTWLGSANMTRGSLKYHANLMTHLDSELFAEAVLLKVDRMTGGPYEEPVPIQAFTIEDQILELRFLPDDQTAISKIKDLIREAKTSIRVAMFTFTREDLADTLIRAHKRGIKVEVIIDLNAGKGSSKKIVELLKRNGVFVALKESGGVMHHKFLLIDDSILEHGSANWTKAAFKQNDDYIIILSNLNPDQKKVLHEAWSSILKAP